MKQKHIFSLLIVFFGFTLISIAYPVEEIFPTKLRVTVIDGLGNEVEGAMVTLYLTEEDYRSSENAIDSGVTDKKGRVTFKDLEPVSYYLDARTGEMNNDGKGAKTAELLEGKINTVNTVIE